MQTNRLFFLVPCGRAVSLLPKSNFVYVGVSLDGYIATADHGLDWLAEALNPEGSDLGYADSLAGIDALIMGRKTFDVVLSFAEWSYTKPVFVLSGSVVDIPKKLQAKVEVVCGDLENLVRELNQRGYENLYIGGGIPLFADLKQSLKFHHRKTEVLLGQLVKSH